jgi:hypothetical protein
MENMNSSVATCCHLSWLQPRWRRVQGKHLQRICHVCLFNWKRPAEKHHCAGVRESCCKKRQLMQVEPSIHVNHWCLAYLEEGEPCESLRLRLLLLLHRLYVSRPSNLLDDCRCSLVVIPPGALSPPLGKPVLFGLILQC